MWITYVELTDATNLIFSVEFLISFSSVKYSTCFWSRVYTCMYILSSHFFCWCCCYWCRFRCRSAIAAVSTWVMRSRPECIFIVGTLIEAPKRTKQFAVIHKDNNKTGKKLFQKKAQTKRVFLHSRVVHVLRSLARRFTTVKHYESVWCVCVCTRETASMMVGYMLHTAHENTKLFSWCRHKKGEMNDCL